MAKTSKRTWVYKGVEKTAYVVRYKVGDRHLSKQFDKQKEAKEYQQKIEREIFYGTHILETDDITVAKLIDLFMKWQEDRFNDGRIRKRSWQGMADCFRLNVEPFLGDRKLSKLKTSDVLDLYRHMRRKNRLSPLTAKLRLKMFVAALEFGRRRGFIKTSEFARDAIAELRGTESEQVRVFSVEQMRSLLAAVGKKRKNYRANQMTRCYVMLGAFCGLRYGEIGGLALNDLDLEKGLIYVRHNLQRDDTLGPPKTKAGVRTVPIPAVVRDSVAEWIQRHYLPNVRKLVFRQRDGSMQDNNCFRTGNWHVVLEAAGLMDDGTKFHFHALRHFAASWMLENGMGIADVARILGHAKFDMTLRTYTHSLSVEQHRADAMEKMATRLVAVAQTP